MKIRILGSGGCISLPRATCQCAVCKEARKKGEPYKRTACSIFLEDIDTIIDTAEDINYQLNREEVKSVKNIFYSHWDPDHSLGMRILEQLQEDWRHEKVKNPIGVYALKDVMSDLLKIKNKFSSYLGYYKEKGLCNLYRGNYFSFNNIEIKLFPVKTNIVATIFLIKEDKKKIIYAPCDIKPFPYLDEFNYSDLLLIGNFCPKEGKYLDENKALYSLKEIINIGKKIKTKKIVITHIEEQWGLSYNDYKNIEKEYDGYVEFAYDSMKITI